MKFCRRVFGLFICMALLFQANGHLLEVFALKEISMTEEAAHFIVSNKTYDSFTNGTENVFNDSFVLTNKGANTSAWHLISATITGDDKGNSPFLIKSDTKIVMSLMLNSSIAPAKSVEAIKIEKGGLLQISDFKYEASDYLGQANKPSAKEEYASDTNIERLREISNKYASLNLKNANFKLDVQGGSGKPAIVNEGTLYLRGNTLNIKGSDNSPAIINNGNIVIINQKGSDKLLPSNLDLHVTGGNGHAAIEGEGNIYFYDVPETSKCKIIGGNNAPAIKLTASTAKDVKAPTFQVYNGTVELEANGNADALYVDGSVAVVGGATLKTSTSAKKPAETPGTSPLPAFRGINASLLRVSDRIGETKYDGGGNVDSTGGIKAATVQLTTGTIKSAPGANTAANDPLSSNMLVNKLDVTGGTLDVVDGAACGLVAVYARDLSKAETEPLVPPEVEFSGGKTTILGTLVGLETHNLKCSGGTNKIGYTTTKSEYGDIYLDQDANTHVANYEFFVTGGSLQIVHNTACVEKTGASADTELKDLSTAALARTDSGTSAALLYPVALKANQDADGLSNAGNQKVFSMKSNDSSYGANDVITDANSLVYVWVPKIENATRVELTLIDSTKQTQYADVVFPLTASAQPVNMKYTCDITINVGVNGAVNVVGSPSPSYNSQSTNKTYAARYGKKVELRVTANTGYAVDAVKLGGVAVSLKDGVYVFDAVKNDQVFNVSFKEQSGTVYTVTFSNVASSDKRPASISLVSGNDVYNATNLTVSVPSGTYEALVTRPGHLSKRITGIKVADKALSIDKNISLINGNASGDDKIGMDDIFLVLKAMTYNTKVPDALLLQTDLDESGAVTEADLGIVRTNYGKVSGTISYDSLS